MAVSFGFRAGSLALNSGGGDMPAGLQSDMDAVLNKKFDTSTTYPPTDWAPTVNLLGPLPEKTASGSVASITDGADGVPLKNWQVTLPASLDGYSSVDVVNTGKNLVNIPDSAEITRNQLVSNVAPLLDDFLNGKKGNFTISAKTAETVENANFITIRINYTDGTYSSNVYIYRGSTHESGEITGTFSISSDPTKTIDSISFGGNTGTAKCAVSEWQIEANSTATTYEPYVAPTTHTVSLGRTIYGGSVDVVKGEGTESYGKKMFDGTEGTGGTPSWTMISVTQGTMFRITVSDKATTRATNTLCSYYTPVAQAQRADGTVSGARTNVDIIDNRFSSVDDFKAWLSENPVTLVYELATPTDFTFDGQEINTRLGYNAFWSEQGDTEVTYRSSGTMTPVVPTLISKTITENATYSAEDDNADGYSQVTVNVPTAPSGMFVMDFTNISSPFTLNGVSYGATGAVFDNTSDYIDLPFFHAGMEIEIDVASISLGQNANRRFFSSYRNQGFLYRNNNVWSFYNGSWYDTNISDSGYFDNSTVKIVVDTNNYWHIYKDDILIFEPAGACAISEPAIGSKDGSCINNATITGVRMKEITI